MNLGSAYCTWCWIVLCLSRHRLEFVRSHGVIISLSSWVDCSGHFQRSLRRWGHWSMDLASWLLGLLLLLGRFAYRCNSLLCRKPLSDRLVSGDFRTHWYCRCFRLIKTDLRLYILDQISWRSLWRALHYFYVAVIVWFDQLVLGRRRIAASLVLYTNSVGVSVRLDPCRGICAIKWSDRTRASVILIVNICARNSWSLFRNRSWLTIYGRSCFTSAAPRFSTTLRCNRRLLISSGLSWLTSIAQLWRLSSALNYWLITSIFMID